MTTNSRSKMYRWLIGAGALLIAAIGIYAIAMPNIYCFPCQSAQGEAKGNLKALYVAEESYRAEHDTYGPLSALAFEAKGRNEAGLRYEYAIETFSQERFRARATAVRDVSGPSIRKVAHALGGQCPDVSFEEIKGDTWVIDEAGVVTNIVKTCSR